MIRAMYHQDKNIKRDFFESQHKSETRKPFNYTKKRNMILSLHIVTGDMGGGQ